MVGFQNLLYRKLFHPSSIYGVRSQTPIYIVILTIQGPNYMENCIIYYFLSPPTLIKQGVKQKQKPTNKYICLKKIEFQETVPTPRHH